MYLLNDARLSLNAIEVADRFRKNVIAEYQS